MRNASTTPSAWSGSKASFIAAHDGLITFAYRTAAPADSPLFDGIATRRSTQGEVDGRAGSPANLTTLAAAGAVPGVDLVLLTDRPQLDRVRDLVVAGNDAQMDDPDFMRELKMWIRFTPAFALRWGDGPWKPCWRERATPTALCYFVPWRARAASSVQPLHRTQLLVNRARALIDHITRVQRRLLLEEHDMALVFCDRIVSHALRNDIHLALAQVDHVVFHFDAQVTLQYQKQLVFARMRMPAEDAMHLGHLDVRIIDLGHHPRRPKLRQRRRDFSRRSYIGHLFSSAD